jgi:hypothetical protein
VLERAKTVRALDRAATAIGTLRIHSQMFIESSSGRDYETGLRKKINAAAILCTYGPVLPVAILFTLLREMEAMPST